jgi:hypothetical protein
MWKWAPAILLQHTPANSGTTVSIRDIRFHFGNRPPLGARGLAWGRNLLVDRLRDAAAGLARFCAALVFAADQKGGNGVLEDELFLGIGFKNNGILVKRAYIS